MIVIHLRLKYHDYDTTSVSMIFILLLFMGYFAYGNEEISKYQIMIGCIEPNQIAGNIPFKGARPFGTPLLQRIQAISLNEVAKNFLAKMVNYTSHHDARTSY